MNDVKTNKTHEGEIPNDVTNNETMPGELVCFFAKALSWLLIIVSAVYGFKVLDPFLRTMVDGLGSLNGTEAMTNTIMCLSSLFSALFLYLLVSICENLIKLNQHNKTY